MADGDLFIDQETGRGELITGPTKADQDLADLYLSDYDIVRDWGADLNLDRFGTVLSPFDFKTMLFMRLNQANERIVRKQSSDQNLTADETITGFSQVNVAFDQDTQNAYFLTVADLVSGGIAQIGGSLDFKPVSLKQIIPPPVDIQNKIVKG